MTEWLIASNNAYKTRDLMACLARVGIQAVSYQLRLPHLQFPNESRTSYAVNAQAKAQFLAQYTSQGVIADDSGIEIPTLHQHLGVTTKRELQLDVAHSNNETLLRAMVGQADRRATMVCTLAAVQSGHAMVIATGQVSGEIATATQGTYSTGFDKLFYLPEQGYTLAQLPDEQRLPLTHRGRAAAQLATELRGD